MGTPTEGTEEVQGNTPDQTIAPGPNPAWNEVLSIIPEEFHPTVTQHFQKWDQAAQSRIETANAQVKQYEDYAPFVEHGISADDLSNGLNLLHAVNNDPKAIYDALRETYNFSHEQAVAAVEEVVEEAADTSTPNPKIAELEQGFNTLAQAYLADQQLKEQQAAEKQLASDFDAAKKKYGDFDESFVIDRITARDAAGDSDYSVDQAVQDYQAFVENIVKSNPRPFAPRVLGANSGGGSGMPSQDTDVTKLSDGDTKKLVADLLRQANAQQ